MTSTSTEPTAHILVVDDDQRIRTLLKQFLVKNGYLVTVARDAAHARRVLAGLAFDLLVIDVMMPGEDGFSLTAAIRKTTECPILLLTARGETEDRITGLESGADDYLPKPFEPRELLLRVAAILRRAAIVPTQDDPPKTLALGVTRYEISRGELWRGESLVRLTSTEAALMRVFAKSPNEALTRGRLVEELGGSAGGAQERAVDVQITRLRRKIENDPKNPRYLQTVRGEGYMLTPD
ncbi:response regulator [Pikeienuella sp. HZG-20]|uniref:response regulator n=1 Tax=Paludibacillus litoralis TaxID=3133267 RepID=UPI0030EDB53C